MSVFPSPNEVIARLATASWILPACLPMWLQICTTKAFKVSCAVIGNGMLSVLSSDDSITDVQDPWKNRDVPGSGSTPDQMSQLLLKQAGLEPERMSFLTIR
jgi:NitT/TauT family transport system substrate-binding protein